MQHHLRIILLSVVTLVLAGQREVTASPCKAAGETCHQSRSCCGTSGNNGTCVKAPGERFGVCACTPTECDPAVDCGLVDNGCGGTNLCPGTLCSFICGDGTPGGDCLPPASCAQECASDCAFRCGVFHGGCGASLGCGDRLDQCSCAGD